jgi:hypothetical protein
MDKIFNQKNLRYFFWTPLGSRVSTYIDNFFFFKFILSCRQSDNCYHCLPPVSSTPVENLPLVSTRLAKPVAKFAACVVDTSGKFATGVVDTGGNFATPVLNLPPVSLIRVPGGAL